MKNELYGEERLLSCIDKFRDDEIDNQISILKADIDQFVGGCDPFDDITIMAVKIK